MSSNILDDLVNSAKKGNTQAFGRLYELYCRDMFRFAYYYTLSETAAEDCVSEAVVIAFQKIGSLKKSASFKSWLFKILRNCCMTYFMRREIVTDVPSEGVHNPAAETDENLSLRNALKNMPDDDREVIILHYCCGYTSKEIGEILSLKDSTVRSKIMRGIEKLRKELL